MATSFTIRPDAQSCSDYRRRTVLVTGAGGNIGSYFAEHSHKQYDLVLLEHAEKELAEVKQYGGTIVADITDLAAMKQACQGVDTVVHLAADPSPSADWESIKELNIGGTYNVMVAAKAAGCRRVIYASSIHAVSGYQKDIQVHTDEPVNPGDLYGVSKCFGEALGRYMAEQEGLSVISLRIGAFQPRDKAEAEAGLKMMDAWVSRRDLNQLICKCIDDDRLLYAVFHGLSDNHFKRLDISDARDLVGYAPEDDLTEINLKVRDLNFDDTVTSHSMQDSSQKSGLRNELTKEPRGKANPDAAQQGDAKREKKQGK